MAATFTFHATALSSCGATDGSQPGTARPVPALPPIATMLALGSERRIFGAAKHSAPQTSLSISGNCPTMRRRQRSLWPHIPQHERRARRWRGRRNQTRYHATMIRIALERPVERIGLSGHGSDRPVADLQRPSHARFRNRPCFGPDRTMPAAQSPPTGRQSTTRMWRSRQPTIGKCLRLNFEGLDARSHGDDLPCYVWRKAGARRWRFTFLSLNAEVLGAAVVVAREPIMPLCMDDASIDYNIRLLKKT